MQPYRGKGEVVSVKFYLPSKNKVNLRMLGVRIQEQSNKSGVHFDRDFSDFD